MNDSDLLQTHRYDVADRPPRRLADFLLSWETILRKRDNYRTAFDGFDPAIVAKYGQKKIRQLLANYLAAEFLWAG